MWQRCNHNATLARNLDFAEIELSDLHFKCPDLVTISTIHRELALH